MIFQNFQKYPDLAYGLSERPDGPMKVNCRNPELRRRSQTNREKFFSRLGVPAEQTVSAGLVHAAHVAKVGATQAGKVISNADGLLAAETNLYLTITVADCLPIFLFAPKLPAIGLIHAGWRGLAQDIAAQAVTGMAKSYALDPRKIMAGIGPGIGKCHFEIQADTAYELRRFGKFLENQNGKIFGDLPSIAAAQLISGGIAPGNLEIFPECTFDRPEKYFSYRREKPQEIQAMVAYIGLKK